MQRMYHVTEAHQAESNDIVRGTLHFEGLS